MRFVSVPRPGTVMEMESPCERYMGGFRPIPTPAGCVVVFLVACCGQGGGRGGLGRTYGSCGEHIAWH